MADTEIQGIVVVRYDETGEIEFSVFGDGRTRLFIVDERCPSDRVYEWSSRDPVGKFREIIPEGTEIGSSQDARHAAIKSCIENLMDGKPARSFTVLEGGCK